MSRSSKEYYHNKGEKDRSEGTYKPPHGIIDDLTTWSRDGMEKNRIENDSYNEGWTNTDDQIKGKK